MDQVLREQVFDKQKAAEQRQGQQHKTQTQHLEQQLLHGLHRRQLSNQSPWAAPTQVTLLNGQQHRLHRGDSQQRISHYRQNNVQLQTGFAQRYPTTRIRRPLGDDDTDCRQRQDDDAEILDRPECRDQQQHQHDGPGQQRDRVRKAQDQAILTSNRLLQQPAVQHHREQAEQQRRQLRQHRLPRVMDQTPGKQETTSEIEKHGQRAEHGRIHRKTEPDNSEDSVESSHNRAAEQSSQEFTLHTTTSVGQQAWKESPA